MFNRNSLHAPDRRDRSGPDVAGSGEPKGPVRSPGFARRTLGFWLGGGVLATGGCILGVCMPYRHPVAVLISALWWGIFLGAFGTSIGAILGLWAEQMPAPPSRRSDGAGTSPGRANSRVFPAGACGITTPAQAGSPTFEDEARM
jgi:hypothetical protein